MFVFDTQHLTNRRHISSKVIRDGASGPNMHYNKANFPQHNSTSQARVIGLCHGN
jgi:hypothetical protein